MNTVSILGCGWLGLPLAEFLVAQGFRVQGSTTTPAKLPEMARKGIAGRLLTLAPGIAAGQQADFRDFLQADVLVAAVPPRMGTHGHAYPVAQAQSLLAHLPRPAPQVVFVSSTSVYPDRNQTVTEASETEAGNGLAEAEALLKARLPGLTVLRCGGLMGYNRIPGRYVAGKTIDTGPVPVNFVHRDDVVRIIHEVIRRQAWGRTYNVVAPLHPPRHAVYARNAADFGYALPVYSGSPPPPAKIVSGEKLIRELGYTFVYPDPVTFFYQPG